jgi:hypothetical protein
VPKGHPGFQRKLTSSTRDRVWPAQGPLYGKLIDQVRSQVEQTNPRDRFYMEEQRGTQPVESHCLPKLCFHHPLPRRPWGGLSPQEGSVSLFGEKCSNDNRDWVRQATEPFLWYGAHHHHYQSNRKSFFSVAQLGPCFSQSGSWRTVASRIVWQDWPFLKEMGKILPDQGYHSR